MLRIGTWFKKSISRSVSCSQLTVVVVPDHGKWSRHRHLHKLTEALYTACTCCVRVWCIFRKSSRTLYYYLLETVLQNIFFAYYKALPIFVPRKFTIKKEETATGQKRKTKLSSMAMWTISPLKLYRQYVFFKRRICFLKPYK